MKKEKIIFLIFSFIIGIALSLQIQTNTSVTGGKASSSKSIKLQNELTVLRNKKLDLQQDLHGLENQIEEIQLSQLEEDEKKQSLKDLTDTYELLAGVREGKGEGIVIKFQATSQQGGLDLLTYNYELLLSVINKLNSSGAEGIAVNDERYVANTSFKVISDKLFINDNPVFPPYEIKAVGNPDTLEAALNLRYGILWEIRKSYNINASIEKKEDIFLPRYTKKMEFKYAIPVEK